MSDYVKSEIEKIWDSYRDKRLTLDIGTSVKIGAGSYVVIVDDLEDAQMVSNESKEKVKDWYLKDIKNG